MDCRTEQLIRGGLYRLFFLLGKSKKVHTKVHTKNKKPRKHGAFLSADNGNRTRSSHFLRFPVFPTLFKNAVNTGFFNVQ